MGKHPSTASRTELQFHKGNGEQISLNIEGLDLSRDHQRIRKLMELLELPEGTKATVTLVTSDVVIR